MIKKNILLFLILLNLLSHTYAQDFTVESITNIENQYTRLQKFTGKVSVKNLGTATEDFSVTNVYLSLDTELNKTEDEYVGFISFLGLDADQSKEGDIAGGANQFGIDAAAGEYYVIVETDTRDEIIETNENNNIFVSSEKITVLNSDVDITANGWLIQSESTLNLGDKFKISTNFINLGVDNVHSVWYEFYLSEDETYDDNDIRLGYLNLGYFNWSNTLAEYDEISVPNTIVKADYNIILRIQDKGQEITINDKQMSNNTIVVGQVNVNGIPVTTNDAITLDDVTFDELTGTITAFHGTQTSVTIPESFNVDGTNINVTRIAARAFQNKSLESVHLPNTIVYIGEYAFAWNQISELNIPNSLTEIGERVFHSNKLTSVNIPNSVVTLGTGAFSENEITSIIFSSNLRTIGIEAFCHNLLTNVDVPSPVTKLGAGAFSSNELTAVSLPEGIDRIGEGAFFLNKITSVNIPESVTCIEKQAFTHNNLTSIIIPSLVDTIGMAAFLNNKITTLVLPDGLKSIERSAFAHNELTSITIPESVVNIEGAAFNWNKITHINNEETNGLIYARNQDGSEDLTRLVSYGGANHNLDFIPEGVTTIIDYALYGTELTSIVLPESITKIGNYGIGYNNISSLVIHDNVTKMGDHAFSNNNLISFVCPENLISIGDYAFWYNDLTSVQLSSKLLSIGKKAFEGNNLTAIILPAWPMVDINWVDGTGQYYYDGDQITDWATSYRRLDNIVAFMDADGTVLLTDANVSEVIPPVVYPPEGMEFIEWNTKQDKTGNTVRDFENIFSDLYVYAQYDYATEIAKNKEGYTNLYPTYINNYARVTNAVCLIEKVEIFDLSGRIVYVSNNIASNNTQLDLSDLCKGIFLAKVTTEKGNVETFKIQKK